MKLALCTTALALALAVSCSVSHRSGDFACGAEQRCADGRTCVDGFCVVAADSGVVDCPPQCTSCNAAQKSCTIDCMLNNGACNQMVTCPAGWSCNVACSVANQCSNVSCDGATSCTIACSARQTCKNVTCGKGACNVTCSGPQSCSNTVACGTGTCGVNCTGNAACSGEVTCGTGACSVNCNGNLACGGKVSCGSACACDVTCQLNAACVPGAVTCKPGCMGSMPLQFCISTATGCNTCP